MRVTGGVGAPAGGGVCVRGKGEANADELSSSVNAGAEYECGNNDDGGGVEERGIHGGGADGGDGAESVGGCDGEYLEKCVGDEGGEGILSFVSQVGLVRLVLKTTEK